MNKRLVVILAIVLAVSYFAFRQVSVESKPSNSLQRQDFSEIKPQNSKAVGFAESGNVRDFAPAQNFDAAKTDAKNVRVVSENLPFRKESATATHESDAALAKTSALPMPTPSLSFDGLASTDNAAVFNYYIIPPDMNGDVGPNHYVQMVNSLVRVFDKNGTALTAPFKISSIFSALGSACSVRDDGLPVVLYDAFADRWMISQYCNNFPPFRQLIAVSKTGDPTGAYFLYEFVMPNIRLNDYAKFGVWHDGYYMSTDEFLGGDFYGSGAFAFDRTKMMRGDSSASYIYFSLPSALAPNRLGNLLPADLDGLNAPPANAPNIFAGYTATEYGDPQDAIRLFDFHADFANPQNSTFTERAESPLPVAAFDPTSPPERTDILQPAPGEPLDSQSDRLMYRVAYRNFGTYDSLVFNQTVRTTPTSEQYRAGVRVYELRRNLLSVPPFSPFTVHEAATLNGNGDGLNRWLGSAAQDYQGNLAVGFSTGNELKKPAISYSGKLATEPPGTFRDEATIISGSGVQTAFGFRWGDYSSMTVDPSDDCTFWYTNEYYTLESQDIPFGWITRIGKFKFDECSPAPRSTITGIVTNASNSAPLSGAIVTANAVYSRTSGANGSYGNLLVLPNTYTLTASANGFRSQTVTVTVVNGQTLTQNFALQPIPVLENTATQITAESCNPNGAVEPNETVTMNISLRNIGGRDTANLTATLLAQGGVINPSAPQNYGAIPTGGASISRPFTFTVSPTVNCGGIVTLFLQLQDGAEILGNVTINLQTGVPRIAFQENFDGVIAPNLPAGWTTSATGGQQNWTTSTTRPQTAPNSVFSPDPFQVGLNELISPVFSITTPNAEFQFRNWYELETTFLRNRLYDGSVLEIKIGSGDWQDIEFAGGVFQSGGYDGVIDGCCQNPLAGRRGWSGRSGINQISEFITSKVKLPASAQGQNVQFRWRIGTDVGTFREGQYLDNLLVTDGFVCSCAPNQNRAPFDFDGDGKTDLSVFRPSNNVNEPDFYVENSSTSGTQSTAWGNVQDMAVNADFDGDGKTDLAVFRPSQNNWFILQTSNNTAITVNFGLPSDKIVPADFDCDLKADFAVFRPSTGTWYVLQSTNGQVRIQPFGIAEDLPTPADFDGDGKTDLAVFRPSKGTWYVLRSSDNGATIFNFGLTGDKPVAGNFDSDAKADFAVFRPSDGIWYLLGSSQGFSAVQFGLSGDKPLQADFDGDGKRDVAVFRPSSGVWYYIKSSDGNIVIRQFGLNGDTPVPSVFANF
ncbi:hypothetical protein BH10ACI1_BH10ACI1_29560 [soil metagenome]